MNCVDEGKCCPKCGGEVEKIGVEDVAHGPGNEPLYRFIPRPLLLRADRSSDYFYGSSYAEDMRVADEQEFTTKKGGAVGKLRKRVEGAGPTRKFVSITHLCPTCNTVYPEGMLRNVLRERESEVPQGRLL